MVHQRPIDREQDPPSDNQFFNWNAKHRCTELRNFKIEATNIF